MHHHVMKQHSATCKAFVRLTKHRTEMGKIIALANQKGGVGKTLFASIYLPMQTVEQENYKACKAAAYERGGLQKQRRTCYS